MRGHKIHSCLSSALVSFIICGLGLHLRASTKILSSEWEVMAANGAALSYGLKENGQIHVNVEKPGPEIWHAQIRHHFAVERGHRYRINLTLVSKKAQV